MAARAKKEKAPAGPNDLTRASAGIYRSGDSRFEVQKSDLGWFLVDTEQANEFGQQLIHGPLATLEAVRDAIPGARELKPLLRVRPAKTAKGKQPTASWAVSMAERKPERPPPPPPPSWIDRLPDKEAAEVRRLIRVLEREGLDDAEELVRRHRDDAAAVISTRLVEQRLRALVGEQPEGERERAQQLVRRATDIMASGGLSVARPAPRWALVEVKPDDELPRGRIKPNV